MRRYDRIESVTFDGDALPLPLSVRLSRRGEPLPAAGDGEPFATSVQLGAATIAAEIRLRGLAAAEELILGCRGDLAIVLGAADGYHRRTVRLFGAVLVAVEHAYEQAAMATALLRFVAEAADGDEDPFVAEETA